MYRHVRAEDDGVRIATEVAPGVVHAARRIVDERAVAERRGPGVDVVVLAGHEVIPHGVGRPHGEAAIPADVPRHAHARREVPPLNVQPGLPLREALIPRINESRRRVEEHLAPDALVEVLFPEDHNREVVDGLAEVRLPPHAAVECHPVRQAPRVLRIRAQVPVVDIQDVRAADLEPRDTSGQEIRKAVPGRAAVNGPRAAGAGGSKGIQSPASHVGPEAELMAAPHHGQVVGHPGELVEGLPLRRCSAHQVEIVGDGQRKLVGGRIAEHLHADIGRAEKPRRLVPLQHSCSCRWHVPR